MSPTVQVLLCGLKLRLDLVLTISLLALHVPEDPRLTHLTVETSPVVQVGEDPPVWGIALIEGKHHMIGIMDLSERPAIPLTDRPVAARLLHNSPSLGRAVPLEPEIGVEGTQVLLKTPWGGHFTDTPNLQLRVIQPYTRPWSVEIHLTRTQMVQAPGAPALPPASATFA